MVKFAPRNHQECELLMDAQRLTKILQNKEGKDQWDEKQ